MSGGTSTLSTTPSLSAFRGSMNLTTPGALTTWSNAESYSPRRSRSSTSALPTMGSSSWATTSSAGESSSTFKTHSTGLSLPSPVEKSWTGQTPMAILPTKTAPCIPRGLTVYDWTSLGNWCTRTASSSWYSSNCPDGYSCVCNARFGGD